MRQIFSITWLDSLQRMRSYQFFMTLVVVLYIASSFVPAPDASYSTVNLGDYRPIYNSAWVGASTAMLTALFIMIIGFFLIEGTIEKDGILKIHNFIRTSRLGVRKYLMMKALSNVVLLLVIVLMVFLMSILMYFIRREEGLFNLLDFMLPFCLVTIPAIILVSFLSVVIEVSIPFSRILRVIVVIMSWSLIIPATMMDNAMDFGYLLDPIGISLPVDHLRISLKDAYGVNMENISFGYQFYDKGVSKSLVLGTLHYPLSFVLSRLFFILIIPTVALMVTSLMKNPWRKINIDFNSLAKQSPEVKIKKIRKSVQVFKVERANSFFALIKLELITLFKSSGKLREFILAGLWTASVFAPVEVGHLFLLPIIYVVYSKYISELGSRPYVSKMFVYSFAFPQHYRRQILAPYIALNCFLLMAAAPILIRYGILNDFAAIVRLIMGVFFMSSLSTFLGVVSKSGRLFEIILIFSTYLLINKIPFIDYLGAIDHSQWIVKSASLCFLTIALLVSSWYFVAQKKLD